MEVRGPGESLVHPRGAVGVATLVVEFWRGRGLIR
jgi:hypothetical protein